MLPQKDYVESKAIVLVIDAIDEVSEYKFRDQLRELNGYANTHPNMRIVLSCRSNYRIHINDDYYTCLYLGTLTSDQVFEIASHNNCISNPSQFMTDVRNAGIAELTANPVFLNEVIEYYAERGKILPRRITGTCAKHQRAITIAVKRARQIAILPYVQD